MLVKKFPVPIRVGYVPSPYEPDDDGVLDVGYALGQLSDGRAYRLECWRMEELLMTTIMFSDLGLEAYGRQDMFLLLDGEELVRFNGTKQSLQAARTEDDAGQKVWALNVMLQNKKGTHGELLIKLNKYK